LRVARALGADIRPKMRARGKEEKKEPFAERLLYSRDGSKCPGFKCPGFKFTQSNRGCVCCFFKEAEMKKWALVILVACASASTAAFATESVGTFSVEPVSMEVAVAKGDLCVLPGKGASSEGAIDVEQGKTIRCVRTQVIGSDGKLKSGRVEWVAQGEIAR